MCNLPMPFVCAQYFYLCPVDIVVSVFKLALSERPAGYSLLLLLQLLAFVAEGAGMPSLLSCPRLMPLTHQ